jgi:hypothetical protein
MALMTRSASAIHKSARLPRTKESKAISSSIQADRPQNFRAKRMKGCDFLSGTSFGPSRSSRAAAPWPESPLVLVGSQNAWGDADDNDHPYLFQKRQNARERYQFEFEGLNFLAVSDLGCFSQRGVRWRKKTKNTSPQSPD